MDDTTRHDATRRDGEENRHTLSLREVETAFIIAGVQRSLRQIQRLCKNGALDAKQLGPAGEWLVSPASVPKVIGDLRAIDARHDATRRDMSQDVVHEDEPQNDDVVSRHDATRRDTQDEVREEKVEDVVATPDDTSRHVATQHDTARHGASELDVYNHPYVKKLEERNEKLEAKYEAQVRRTEEVQLIAQKQLVELQRMTSIGQSKTLADFMLQARDWIAGNPVPAEKREEVIEQNQG